MFPGQKDKTDEVLIHRLERILNDLDHIYVNIVRMLRSKDYEKEHRAAMDQCRADKNKMLMQLKKGNQTTTK
jgi:hypothetical protein